MDGDNGDFQNALDSDFPENSNSGVSDDLKKWRQVIRSRFFTHLNFLTPKKRRKNISRWGIVPRPTAVYRSKTAV